MSVARLTDGSTQCRSSFALACMPSAIADPVTVFFSTIDGKECSGEVSREMAHVIVHTYLASVELVAYLAHVLIGSPLQRLSTERR